MFVPLIGLLLAIFVIMLARRARKEIDAVIAAGYRPVHAKTKEPIDRSKATDPLMMVGIGIIVLHGIGAVLFLLIYLSS